MLKAPRQNSQNISQGRKYVNKIQLSQQMTFFFSPSFSTLLNPALATSNTHSHPPPDPHFPAIFTRFSNYFKGGTAGKPTTRLIDCVWALTLSYTFFIHSFFHTFFSVHFSFNHPPLRPLLPTFFWRKKKKKKQPEALIPPTADTH